MRARGAILYSDCCKLYNELTYIGWDNNERTAASDKQLRATSYGGGELSFASRVPI